MILGLLSSGKANSTFLPSLSTLISFSTLVLFLPQSMYIFNIAQFPRLTNCYRSCQKQKELVFIFIFFLSIESSTTLQLGSPYCLFSPLSLQLYLYPHSLIPSPYSAHTLPIPSSFSSVFKPFENNFFFPILSNTTDFTRFIILFIFLFFSYTNKKRNKKQQVTLKTHLLGACITF